MARKKNTDLKCYNPKSTAYWLKLNTKLTENQICNFTGINLLTYDALHLLNISPESPILNSQLTEDEIYKAEQEETYNMKNFLISKYNNI